MSQTPPATQPWDLMLVAVSDAAPAAMLEHLGRCLAACGAWVSRQSKVSEICADIDFEFSREVTVEIYALLVGTGLSLTGDGHRQLTELCHCTGQLDQEQRETVARINLSVYLREGSDAFLGEQDAHSQAA